MVAKGHWRVARAGVAFTWMRKSYKFGWNLCRKKIVCRLCGYILTMVSLFYCNTLSAIENNSLCPPPTAFFPWKTSFALCGLPRFWKLSVSFPRNLKSRYEIRRYKEACLVTSVPGWPRSCRASSPRPCATTRGVWTSSSWMRGSRGVLPSQKLWWRVCCSTAVEWPSWRVNRKLWATKSSAQILLLLLKPVCGSARGSPESVPGAMAYTCAGTWSAVTAASGESSVAPVYLRVYMLSFYWVF